MWFLCIWIPICDACVSELSKLHVCCILSLMCVAYLLLYFQPCSVCEEGVLITLCLSVTYNMAEMQERCTKWINTNRIKIWRTEAFARLPPEVMEICYNAAVSSMASIFVCVCEWQKESIEKIMYTINKMDS